MMGLDTLVGYNVITQSRRKIGKVRGFTFNINSGVLELPELDSFGISFIPSSLEPLQTCLKNILTLKEGQGQALHVSGSGEEEDTRKVFPQSERGLTETLETNNTSSSGGYGGSFIGTDRQSASIHSHKRKGRDADESEYHSEDAEFESANANKAPPRSGPPAEAVLLRFIICQRGGGTESMRR
ncbi:hypothetical protein IFM89_006296 [Coptis chinensis]|uniref:PRC-barrel domain-containing protein n=1 Tax=Coptis chinensis TaxID=261450 RepID=A0A835GUV0_9MAGN|nr:hypothetical protein IFM89_006296 [Coptis chinensis]